MIAGHLQEKYGFFYIVLSYRDENGKRRLIAPPVPLSPGLAYTAELPR